MTDRPPRRLSIDATPEMVLEEALRDLRDVRWLSIEDRKPGKGTGRHIAAFILEPK